MIWDDTNMILYVGPKDVRVGGNVHTPDISDLRFEQRKKFLYAWQVRYYNPNFCGDVLVTKDRDRPGTTPYWAYRTQQDEMAAA